MPRRSMSKCSKTPDFSAFYHIHILLNDIIQMRKALNVLLTDTRREEPPSETDNTIYRVLLCQILIRSESFFDEWNHCFNPTRYPESNILEFKKCLHPVTSKIKNWKDSRLLRSEVLAHNFRDGDGVSIFIKRVKNSYNAPDNILDIQILTDCFSIVSYFFWAIYQPQIDSFRSMFQFSQKTFNIHNEAIEEQIDNLKDIRSKVEQNFRSSSFKEKEKK